MFRLRLTNQPGSIRVPGSRSQRREMPRPARTRPRPVPPGGLVRVPPTTLPGGRGPRRSAPVPGAGRSTAHLVLRGRPVRLPRRPPLARGCSPPVLHRPHITASRGPTIQEARPELQAARTQDEVIPVTASRRPCRLPSASGPVTSADGAATAAGSPTAHAPAAERANRARLSPALECSFQAVPPAGRRAPSHGRPVDLPAAASERRRYGAGAAGVHRPRALGLLCPGQTTPPGPRPARWHANRA